MERTKKQILIDELEAQICFEKQRTLEGEWTEDYREGFVDGLQQGLNLFLEVFKTRKEIK